jgi:hypothetical protein
MASIDCHRHWPPPYWHFCSENGGIVARFIGAVVCDCAMVAFSPKLLLHLSLDQQQQEQDFHIPQNISSPAISFSISKMIATTILLANFILNIIILRFG